jgi:uncharacterized RDD family membrane protein YckC
MNCSNCGTQVNGPQCAVCGVPAPLTLLDDSRPSSELAGWWRRVGATVIDNLILFIPTLIVYAVVTDVAGSAVGAVASIALQGVYMVRLLASPRGQTIGNRVAASRVRDALTGQALSSRQAIRRWLPLAVYSVFELSGSSLVFTLAAVVAAVDYLYPLFNARKQTLHDKLAGTIVLKVQA